MAIFHLENNELRSVPDTGFAEQGILERAHIQQALIRNIKVIAPNCLVIAEEFSEWSEGKRRIDLLAVDKNANLVVIELKRGETGELMELQTIRYAAMISTTLLLSMSSRLCQYLKQKTTKLAFASKTMKEKRLVKQPEITPSLNWMGYPITSVS